MSLSRQTPVVFPPLPGRARGVFEVDPRSLQIPPADARAVDLTDASGATIGQVWIRRQDGAILDTFAWALLNAVCAMPPSDAYLWLVP